MRKNNFERLQDEYGVLAHKENGRVYFSGLLGISKRIMQGNTALHDEIYPMLEDVERNYDKYVQRDNRIVVELPRHTLVLYPNEVMRLALTDEKLYLRALQRGKSELRYRAYENRKK